SLTSSIVEYSWKISSILTEVIATPARDLYRTRLIGFPNVIPNPFWSGAISNFPYFSSDSISETSGFGMGISSSSMNSTIPAGEKGSKVIIITPNT
ncbi:MAG: hypothetical protein MK228_05440, partial [Nitrososphaerales archaeon]|nr:hypothetical protein [Nitrososphaerales archaeon]